MSHYTPNKKGTIEIWALTLSCVCPKTGEAFEKQVDYHDIQSDVSECDLCGSHGHVSIWFPCPLCKEMHEVEIKSW